MRSLRAIFILALICLPMVITGCNSTTWVAAYKWDYAENCIEVRDSEDTEMTTGVYCKVEVERK